MEAKLSAESAKLESEERETENQSEREASDQNADTDTSSIALHDPSRADEDEIDEDRTSSYNPDERYSEKGFLDKRHRLLSHIEIFVNSHPDQFSPDIQPEPQALASQGQKYARLLG